jgi:ubiquinone/menaquinone biosynthesis C-methylase UbiE
MAMNSDLEDFEVASKKCWNDSYVLVENENLWGSPAVPYVFRAIPVLQNGGVILDIPCGDGRNTIELAKASSMVIGADASVNALSLAKNVLEKNGLDSRALFLEADVFRTKFLSNQFAGVFCWDLLGHLRDPMAALQELVRICRSGGKIVGSVFSMDDPARVDNSMSRLSDDTEEYFYLNKFYFRFYHEAELRDLLGKLDAKVEVVELSRWTEAPHEGYREYEHEHESWAFTLTKL